MSSNNNANRFKSAAENADTLVSPDHAGDTLDGTTGRTGLPLTFGLDDSSDSDDSLHQFLHSGRAGARVACRRPKSLHDDTPEDEDEDKEDYFLDNGLPYCPFGVATTRPPSPDRPIAAIQFRAAASEPAAGQAAAVVAPVLSPLALAAWRGTNKKRQSESQQQQQQPAASPSEHSMGSCYVNEASDCLDTDLAIAAVAAETVATTKRRRVTAQPLRDATNQQQPPPPLLSRCMSENCGLDANTWRSAGATTMDSLRIDKAIASIDSLNLIGNSQQGHSLPTVKELDFGIRYVAPSTVSRLLAGHYSDRISHYAIVDCRYPYEYNGGHVRGAINIYRPEELLDRLPLTGGLATATSRVLLIFHCEFSSERAPRMARLLRQRDREANSLSYPQLHYPELYLLQGGYRAFYEGYKADCEPASYTKMADPGHKQELAYYHRMGKAWERQNSRTKHSRLQSMVGSPLLM